MSKEMKDGGAAFPHKHMAHPGMTLLDWFAGMSVQGLLASPANNTLRGKAPGTSAQIAEMAYSTADAMIKEREK